MNALMAIQEMVKSVLLLPKSRQKKSLLIVKPNRRRKKKLLRLKKVMKLIHVNQIHALGIFDVPD